MGPGDQVTGPTVINHYHQLVLIARKQANYTRQRWILSYIGNIKMQNSIFNSFSIITNRQSSVRAILTKVSNH